MAYDIFELAIFAMLGVAGLFGGIPQLIRWTKPRPNLTITKVAIERLPGDNYKYQIHMEIENRSKFWRRNSDATNVNADYYMINKDGVQCGAASNQTVASFLVAGAKILKDVESFHSLVPEGNPYSIVFRVTCQELVAAKKKIMYQASPMVYA